MICDTATHTRAAVYGTTLIPITKEGGSLFHWAGGKEGMFMGTVKWYCFIDNSGACDGVDLKPLIRGKYSGPWGFSSP